MANNKDWIILKKVSICDTVSSGEHVFYIGDVTVSESTDEIMKMLFDFITHKKSIFKGRLLLIVYILLFLPFFFIGGRDSICTGTTIKTCQRQRILVGSGNKPDNIKCARYCSTFRLLF